MTARSDQNERKLPACPDCGAEMQRGTFENEEHDWHVRWLCDCVAEVPDPI